MFLRRSKFKWYREVVLNLGGANSWAFFCAGLGLTMIDTGRKRQVKYLFFLFTMWALHLRANSDVIICNYSFQSGR